MRKSNGPGSREHEVETREQFVERMGAELHEIGVELELGQKAVEDRKHVSGSRDRVHDSVRALRDDLDDARRLLEAASVEGEGSPPLRERLQRAVSELRKELAGLRRAETP